VWAALYARDCRVLEADDNGSNEGPKAAGVLAPENRDPVGRVLIDSPHFQIVFIGTG